ncbi:MAG TPA: hypothetical protein V6C90_20190 [Coleofasciculaceae cyanobacterium]
MLTLEDSLMLACGNAKGERKRSSRFAIASIFPNVRSPILCQWMRSHILSKWVQYIQPIK